MKNLHFRGAQLFQIRLQGENLIAPKKKADPIRRHDVPCICNTMCTLDNIYTQEVVPMKKKGNSTN
jgi:hypothetical protein